MIKRLLRYPFLVAVAVVLISSCDKIDPPYKETSSINPNPNPNDTSDTNESDTVFRKILIEDYTGFRCGSCPPAAVELYTVLAPVYGEELITIGVHASTEPGGQWTEPCPPHSLPPGANPGDFAVDYRTPVGNTWFNSSFLLGANPRGMVNRIGYPTSQHVKEVGDWGGAAQAIYHQVAKFKIEISNVYTTATGNLDCNVKVKVMQAVSGTYNLTVLLTEDSIVDWQVWYPPHSPVNVPDYVHRHVLRGAMTNDPLGVPILVGSSAINDSVVSPYNINLLDISSINNASPTPTLNIGHCHIVAFVSDAATREILQVEEKKVQ